MNKKEGDVTEENVKGLFLHQDCSRSSWVSLAVSAYILSMRLHEHKGCACIWVTGCTETSEWSNATVPAPGDMGREPYMGFSAERGSWVWRGREASCSPKTWQSPAGPRQPCKLGRSCETRSSQPARAGHGWSTHTLLHMLSKSVHEHLSVCAQICVCLGIIFRGHRHTQEFLCIWSHSTLLHRVCVLILQVSSLKGMLTSDSSPTPHLPPCPCSLLIVASLADSLIPSLQVTSKH